MTYDKIYHKRYMLIYYIIFARMSSQVHVVTKRKSTLNIIDDPFDIPGGGGELEYKKGTDARRLA